MIQDTIRHLVKPTPSILLADDDEVFRTPLARLLGRDGFDVVCVEDSAGAIQALREREFDLLISDIHMPGNAHLELIRELPQVVRGLPVILMTGYPGLDTAISSVGLAVTAYLTKPIVYPDFIRLVTEATSRHQRARQLGVQRERVKAWVGQLRVVAEALRSGPSPASVSQEELLLMAANLAKVMNDLVEVSGPAGALFADHPTSERDHLIAALRETVDTLQRTKRSFKSKELGELRAKLTSLLDSEPGTTDPKREPGTL